MSTEDDPTYKQSASENGRRLREMLGFEGKNGARELLVGFQGFATLLLLEDYANRQDDPEATLRSVVDSWKSVTIETHRLAYEQLSKFRGSLEGRIFGAMLPSLEEADAKFQKDMEEAVATIELLLKSLRNK